MKRFPLVSIILILAACDPIVDSQEMGWDVTPDGLECTNPDLITNDGACVWYCRDFTAQKNADLFVSHYGGRLHMQIKPSKNC